ncbi:MAG: thioredoxin domain-containing protein [Candidatus Kryptonium sp.]|nr:thioredoxin domain-containing protein [Candidatus Kryptonium sp.]MCX7761306.1 thioredoxin domain-containing protein [Candidatus Kryptonium sp.]MDW8108915.1 thioredoxin domain-containing protein [Candidatus Kryptonium sp.]
MKKYNRLINEKSPYLLQHAENPVDWYPWCEEAFEKAKFEDKPIFLSIGYSTCHWCHVMEKESFEDEEVAKILNENFISIKVDREERPDIDSVYMSVCQAMTGHGGWPLTIIMTPDKKPFFAGTYIPKYSRYGRIGLIDLLQRVSQLWKENKEKLLSLADEITTDLKQAFSQSTKNDTIDESVLSLAYNQLKSQFDPEYGGFGNAPKFPIPHNFMFLLRYWRKAKNPIALEMIEKTLNSMYLGGIYDHIGFGFHRYSTDRYWILPHFEKMLYDQALLLIAYLETYQATQNQKYARICDEISSYVLRNLTNPNGGFFSAEDADSEGEEGKFYLWEFNELKEILNQDEFDFVVEKFNIQIDGNYYDEVRKNKTGKNIFYLTRDLSDENIAKWEAIRQKLFKHREKRIHPLKDDKILTDWNGLMICAFARAYSVLRNEIYLNIAKKSADFILENLLRDGKLLHRFRDGEAKINAYLNDYAFLIWGLIELYESSFETKYLKHAIVLTEKMIKLFWDDEKGGFYFTDPGNEDVIFREKEIYDGAIPSGNSVALLDLIKLEKITGREDFKELIHKTIDSFAYTVKNYPSAYTFFLSNLYFIFDRSLEIFIVGKREDLNEILKIINSKFLPNKIILFNPSDVKDEIATLSPFISQYKEIDGKTTIYICTNYECLKPVNSIDELTELLETL